MKLRRGFKSEATKLALEVRAELGLGPLDGLDPLGLAQYLEIPVEPLSRLVPDSARIQYFLAEEQEAFSALTVFDGHRRIIVHNDSHSKGRQNSDLAHELAHALLLHEPEPALDPSTGCRNWNDGREEEANWLGGELLVTSDMALAVARGKFTEQEARERLGVSEAMLRWRINATGANKRVQRERMRRRESKISTTAAT